MLSIDEIDRAILNRIQSDFPITTRPYLSIAQDLHLSEDQVIKRIKRLKKKGLICVRQRSPGTKLTNLPEPLIVIQG
jgi:DNA-binding Lrp family transcriptional regulator